MIEKRKLTVADFLRMGETGVFAPDERVELLDGEIYTVLPPSPQHAGMVKRIAKLLEQSYGDHCIVSVQDPLVLNDYRLTEPDIALLKPNPSFYADRHPQAEDALLVVEVSRSSLFCLGPTPAPHGLGRYDKVEKLPRYAESGIAEVWIIDVDAELLEVHREPVSGRYRVRLLLGLDEAVTPVAVPDASEIVF